MDEENGFFAWGAIPGIRNNPTWKALKINDWVFCVYGGAYHFISRVKAKFDNYNCAKNIWGLDEDGQNTWQLMYFLTKPQKPKKGFIETNNLDKYLHKSYMGFTKISDDRLKDIENEFGSVDHFVEKNVLEKEFESQEHQILKELALKSESGSSNLKSGTTNWGRS